MNKIEEILQSKETYDPEYPTISISDALEAMKEFGKICFEASRENKTKYSPTKDGKLYQISIIPEYSIYEDFLKEIEDEKE